MEQLCKDRSGCWFGLQYAVTLLLRCAQSTSGNLTRIPSTGGRRTLADRTNIQFGNLAIWPGKAKRKTARGTICVSPASCVSRSCIAGTIRMHVCLVLLCLRREECVQNPMRVLPTIEYRCPSHRHGFRCCHVRRSPYHDGRYHRKTKCVLSARVSGCFRFTIPAEARGAQRLRDRAAHRLRGLGNVVCYVEKMETYGQS